MKPIKLIAVPVKQAGQMLYVTSLPVTELIDRDKFRTNVYHEGQKKDEQGYQREVAERHASKIATYLEGKGSKSHANVLPGSILINSSPSKVNPRKSKDGTVTIELNSYPYWIVDGQHRIRGAEIANKEREVKLQDYDLPVVISEFGHLEEAEIFATMNSTAKRVDTSLVQLLRRHFMFDEDVDYSQDQKIIWEIAATSAALDIRKEKNSPWFSRITLANEKAPRGVFSIKQTSFVKSLKPIFSSGPYQTINPRDIAKKTGDMTRAIKEIVDFWNAVQKTFPEAFADPKSYVIQKTPGFFSLHGLLGKILTKAQRNGVVPDEAYFRRALKTMADNFRTIDNKKMTYDFWRKGKGQEGAEGAGSMKGFAILEKTMWYKLDENFDWAAK
jgi:DGQHR domain-containing protein